MNGAEHLVAAAVEAQIEVCFANPGTTEMPLVAALDRIAGIRAVLGLFEGVCTGAADGYGRMTGRPALTLLHLGPGFANGIANLHNARRARSPIVNLIGDQASWHLRHDAPLTSDIVSLAAPVSGWLKSSSAAIHLAADLKEAIAAAIGPPGQVSSLILPADHQWEEAGPLSDDDGSARRAPAPSTRRVAPQERIEAAAKRLRAARSSALLLGADALTAQGQQAAARIAAASGCRVWVETFPARWERGRPLPAFGRLPYFPEQAQEALAPTEVLVLAGAREPVSFFGYAGVPSTLAPPGATSELSAPTENSTRALCDLAACFDDVGTAPDATAEPASPPDATAEIRGPLNPGSVGAVLAALLPENAIVVDEAATSGLPFYAASAAAAPHTLLTLTGGAIGQGLPCASGAAIACPDRPVIAFQADGSAAYTAQALWTQARESLHVITLLCSNRAYRILQVELARSGIAEAGSKAASLMSLDSPALDWVALAKGYGVPAERVESAEAMAVSLRAALSSDGPSLIELAL